MLVGIDEVGRGSWAGPLLVVAARATSQLPVGLRDSKLLSKLQRANLLQGLKNSCDFGEGWVKNEEIDQFGLSKAMQLGVTRALIMLGASFEDEIIMDGKINYCPSEYTRVSVIAKADNSHPIVSAASIYAKLLRDEHMLGLSKLYPNYQFDKHVGYGTKLHRELLKKHGICALHRLSYRPVKQMLNTT